ncbi:UDP-D-galactose:(glucosyl)lipopolysaccharide-1,6-D-galactosyltransferase [Pragia fontium]|uniref:lipopolysaccharide 1,6-galactosyltransferase n=1 Tax=Pragia fontium TaxID=82985 RepID=UPI000DFDD4C4|nr:lipopolysaccharide 1,6-galactosyltransferase [Pragia fontium]SUB83105.1 UDP-D-galactose:(glucosyl)lipopolysaccharide-1,6-D-galactosyltransferase [Pragia fontium]
MDINKIIIVSNALSGFGGTETVVRAVIDFLQRDNPEIKIKLCFINHGNGVENKAWLGNNDNISLTSKISNNKLKRWSISLSLARQVKRYQPDVIIALDPLSCYLSDLSRKFLFKRIPLISWGHSSLNHIYRSAYYLHADAHLAISSGIARQLQDMGIMNQRIHTIFNPTSNTEVTIPRPISETKFLYLGRILFEESKRLKDLLETLAHIKGDWSLDVVGDGADLERCKHYALSLGIAEKVTWHGWQASPWEYINQSIKTVTAQVMTSAYEGFSMTIGEAMSRGIYFVSSNCPTGPEDIIIEHVNGEVYQPGDLQHLQHILQSIVDGKILPESSAIKNSIQKFYDEHYFPRFKAALIESIKKSRH